MELTLLIDPALRVARLREVASLAAGDSCSLVLDGIPGADPATLSAALYRDASMADLVAAASPEGGAPAFSRVPGHARRFASAEPWRLDSIEMADWFAFEADRLEESSDGGGSAVPRGWTRDDRRTSAERAMRADGWLVVADASRVWVACRVPVVLRDIVGRGHLSGDSISSIVQGAVASALDGKVDKVPGMSLSSNDFTDALKARLEGIEAGAERNVQADWDESDSTADAFVRNRPGLATESEDGLMPAADRAKVAGLDAALAAKADLVDGKVPASQLPSYVDDVLEFASSALFPDEGEAGKIYVATGTGLAYRWSGSAYVAVAAPTEIGSDDGQAFPGPRGALLERTAVAHGATLEDLEAAVSALASAERNVQADWEESDAEDDAYIRRKPRLAAVATSGLYSDLDGAPALASVATSGRYADLDGAPALSRVAATGRYSDLDGAPALASVATSGRYSDLEGRPSAGGLAVRFAPIADRVATLADSTVSTVASSAGSASWTAWGWSSPSWSSGTDGLSQPVRDGDAWVASDPVRGIGLSAEADSESSDDMTADGGPSVLEMSGTWDLTFAVKTMPTASLEAGYHSPADILGSDTTPLVVECVTRASDPSAPGSVEIPVVDLLASGSIYVDSGGLVYGTVGGLRYDGVDFAVDLTDPGNAVAYLGGNSVGAQFHASAAVSAMATRRWLRLVDALRLPEPRADRLSRVVVVDLVSDGTPVRLLDESSDSVDMPVPSPGPNVYQVLDSARGPLAVRLTPDRTLSVEGAPADAKAVGDALGGMMSDRIEDSDGDAIDAKGNVYAVVGMSSVKVDELAHRSELVRADWDESDSGDLSFIRNKPLPDATLSMPGALADAGAVGDALGQITVGVAGLGGRVETVETTLVSKANAATTLAGYGITDAKIENGTITLGGSTITPITQIPTATLDTLGMVKPDGTTITVADGVISAALPYPFVTAMVTQDGPWAFSEDGDYSVSETEYDGTWSYVLSENGAPVDSQSFGSRQTSVEFSFIPSGEAVPVTLVATRTGQVTVTPRTVATYTADTSAAAFTVAVGTGTTGAARDCVLVVDCTAAGAVAPSVEWPSNFHPRTDAEEIAPVAGVRNVFYISEYATGEFVVGGWHEEAE